MILNVHEYHTSFFYENISAICKGFLDENSLTYFQYDRAYSDSGRIVFTTRLDWLAYCLDNRFYEISYFERSPQEYHDLNILWKYTPERCAIVYQHAKDHFNIDNGFSIVRNHEDYCEFFHFAMERNNDSAINTYSSILPNLLKFTYLFPVIAKDIIEKSLHNKIYYPLPKSKQIHTHLQKDNQPTFTFAAEFHLTFAEKRCLAYLAKGYTIREIADLLQVTVRTIDEHIKNIKSKTNCRTLFQLGELFIHLDYESFLFSKKY